jgi:hypothetical protein
MVEKERYFQGQKTVQVVEGCCDVQIPTRTITDQIDDLYKKIDLINQIAVEISMKVVGPIPIENSKAKEDTNCSIMKMRLKETSLLSEQTIDILQETLKEL